mmetsp:Transcript_89336/g.178525  ORF Transcript_89336/g.178525 Transcript_89336/m.178525 type:complete len:209 (-) Transcript_89336:1147-1773(-)
MTWKRVWAGSPVRVTIGRRRKLGKRRCLLRCCCHLLSTTVAVTAVVVTTTATKRRWTTLVKLLWSRKQRRAGGLLSFSISTRPSQGSASARRRGSRRRKRRRRKRRSLVGEEERVGNSVQELGRPPALGGVCLKCAPHKNQRLLRERAAPFGHQNLALLCELQLVGRVLSAPRGAPRQELEQHHPKRKHIYFVHLHVTMAVLVVALVT